MKVGPWHGLASMHANSYTYIHICIPDIRMHTILALEFPRVLCLLPAIVMSFFLPLYTISLYLSTFPSSIDVFVSFSTTLTQVREDNGSLALTLQSTQAASQPFTVHLNSRLLRPGDNTATGECTVCCRSRMDGSWLE